MKLLIVEDDRDMAATLKMSLKNDYLVDSAYSGEEGLYQLSINEYDLIILDYMLPGISGLEVITELKKKNIVTPRLILTGIDAVDIKVLALDSGGDDYLVKPVHIKELKARIRLLLRRHQANVSSKTFSVGDLTIDVASKTVSREKTKIILRRKEFDLLEFFIRNPGKVLTRSMILDHIWDSSYDSFTNVVDVHVNYLRKKIDKPFQRALIKTVHGIGYKLEY
jgi:DNA-binding response OmpR family regulator